MSIADAITLYLLTDNTVLPPMQMMRISQSAEFVEQRKANDAAFKVVCDYITLHIVGGGGVMRMSSLHELYLGSIQHNSSEYYNANHTTQKLNEKIIRHFGVSLTFWQPNNCSELIYSTNLSTGAAIGAAFEAATSDAKLLEDAASSLRRNILEASNKSDQMPWPPTSQYLMSGAKEPPEVLVDILKLVFNGKPGEQSSPKLARLATSKAADICSATTSSRWSQLKHLLLGVTLKPLTGSAQIITIVNRMGHCSSYKQVLDLENSMALKTFSTSSVLLSNINSMANRFSHFCFDNFDVIEETVWSWNDALHTWYCYSGIEARCNNGHFR